MRSRTKDVKRLFPSKANAITSVESEEPRGLGVFFSGNCRKHNNCWNRKHGLWSPNKVSIEYINSDGFLSPNPFKSKTVLCLSVSESSYAMVKKDFKVWYLLSGGGEEITDRARVAVDESSAGTT